MSLVSCPEERMYCKDIDILQRQVEVSWTLAHVLGAYIMRILPSKL